MADSILGKNFSTFKGAKGLQGKTFGGEKLGMVEDTKPENKPDTTGVKIAPFTPEQETKYAKDRHAKDPFDYGKIETLSDEEKAAFEGSEEDLYKYGYLSDVGEIMKDYKSSGDSPALFISEMMENPAAVRAVKDLYPNMSKELEKIGEYDRYSPKNMGVDEKVHDYAVSRMFKRLWDNPRSLAKFQNLLKYHAASIKASEKRPRF